MIRELPEGMWIDTIISDSVAIAKDQRYRGYEVVYGRNGEITSLKAYPPTAEVHVHNCEHGERANS